MKRHVNYCLFVFISIALVISASQILAYLQKKSGLENQLVVASVEPVIHQTNNQITVTNIGNVDIYLRIHCSVYQENSDQSLTIIDEKTMMDFIVLKDEWMKLGQIYYYQKPIEPGEVVEFATLKGNLLPDMQLDIFAESIQQKPAKAVKEAWQIDVDENDRLMIKK